MTHPTLFLRETPRRLAAGTALALLALSLSACGGGDGAPPSSTPTAPTTPDTSVKPEMRCAP